LLQNQSKRGVLALPRKNYFPSKKLAKNHFTDFYRFLRGKARVLGVVNCFSELSINSPRLLTLFCPALFAANSW
jgi:hypothetical protein